MTTELRIHPVTVLRAFIDKAKLAGHPLAPFTPEFEMAQIAIRQHDTAAAEQTTDETGGGVMRQLAADLVRMGVITLTERAS